MKAIHKEFLSYVVCTYFYYHRGSVRYINFIISLSITSIMFKTFRAFLFPYFDQSFSIRDFVLTDLLIEMVA